MRIPHYIGEYYGYYSSPKKFKLVEVKNCIYYFKCGHWVTDSVFVDLVRLKTGVQGFMENVQLEMKF